MLYCVGLMFIVVGVIFKAFPPKKINCIYGYRTSFSVKNQNIWNEAQKYSANSFIILGLIYVSLGFVLNQLIRNPNNTCQTIILLTGIAAMLVFDEWHLRKVFNSDGSRK